MILGLGKQSRANFKSVSNPTVLTICFNSVCGFGLSEKPLRKMVKLEGYFPGTPPAPGWSGQIHSWTYQSLGGVFGSHIGKEADKEGYNTFGAGDVIGCGFNVKEKTVFYTHNGERLGTSKSRETFRLSC
jgi:SPRY domain